jgi:AraC-like DNA-binding protein
MRSESFGFDLYRHEVHIMDMAHRHQELELNLLFQGAMTYLFGGSTLELRQGQVALFWATTPHRLISCDAGTECGWITLPLANFLRYGLPEHLSATVLQGTPVIAAFSELEGKIFERWLEDFEPHHEAQKLILELELEAWLRRIALGKPKPFSSKHASMDSKAAQLAQFISENYQEPLNLAAIAAAVSLHPSYAATLFKKSLGMTINDYLTQHRIAHAQRLLVTTDMPILELAFDAGFGSSSQFYTAFVKACGATPKAYRKALKH